MAPSTTALESRSKPVLRRSTVSQRAVPALADVPASVKGQEARSLDLALRGTVQASYSAMRTEYALVPNPLGAGYARITTQNSPSAIDNDLKDADGLEICNNLTSVRTAHTQAGLIKHAPRDMTRKRTRKVQSLD